MILMTIILLSKKFAIIRLPCKHILTCRLKITLRNMNCKHDSDEQYYLRSSVNYYKTEKLINLLKTDPIDEQQILGFVNDANHINMISKDVSNLLVDQRKMA
ncbi:unnamed protein product [Didymodactylos carnosus]|uniref:Uncharacterized protein n=1 Tax=Didymodactylos carnosus TaxID=1234261 RepID=A0A8S2TMX7_9BILA|nr:unnamed protein product [Didymodactylos carnosus]CAF4294696.1 unnamed protein product [Didymodactylos carnosus]